MGVKNEKFAKIKTTVRRTIDIHNISKNGPNRPINTGVMSLNTYNWDFLRGIYPRGGVKNENFAKIKTTVRRTIYIHNISKNGPHRPTNTGVMSLNTYNWDFLGGIYPLVGVKNENFAKMKTTIRRTIDIHNISKNGPNRPRNTEVMSLNTYNWDFLGVFTPSWGSKMKSLRK